MIKTGFYITVIIFSSYGLFAQSDAIPKSKNSNNITLGVTDTINSSILLEKRPINIYIPEGYSSDSSIAYPVIYLLDGGINEDFIHISGLIRYLTTPWIDLLPKSIVVGIENVNRTRDFTFPTSNLNFVTKMGIDTSVFRAHGESKNFAEFIEKELQPFMQTHYKINSSKTIIGESLGGLLATEVLIRKPELFDTYIIVSPSLWWGNELLLKEQSQLTKPSFRNKLKIYIAASNKKENIIMFEDAQNLALKLRSFNKSNVQISFDYLENETHATILHQAVYNAFKMLYPKPN